MIWLKRHYKTIIVLAILASTIISMIQLKPAYELGRDSGLEERFKVAQLILILTIGYVVFSFLFNKWREYQKLKNAHTQAQLELLKSKMDPHFFFNTLNNLYGLAIEKSDDTAPIILKLSEVMRYTIYNGEKERVSLRDEIEHLRQYIDIHKIRYKKKVDIRLTEDLADKEFLIAPLLFINLLENAFKHGIESLTDNAFIQISIQATGNKVCFEIENNFGPSTAIVGGMGLKSLEKRLTLIYPKRHTLSIQKTDSIHKVTLVLTIS